MKNQAYIENIAVFTNIIKLEIQTLIDSGYISNCSFTVEEFALPTPGDEYELLGLNIVINSFEENPISRAWINSLRFAYEKAFFDRESRTMVIDKYSPVVRKTIYLMESVLLRYSNEFDVAGIVKMDETYENDCVLQLMSSTWSRKVAPNEVA